MIIFLIFEVSCWQIITKLFNPSRTRLLLVIIIKAQNPPAEVFCRGNFNYCIRTQEVKKPHISSTVKAGGVQKKELQLYHNQSSYLAES